jgi:prepilin signal peptidase PulO-like enzyme (type II secretory pathway)
MLLTYLSLLVLGAVFGSFISAYSYRWPRDISISEGRSFCPKCKAKIAWFDNIPFFSYLLLGGKCRSCHKKISPRYPFIELTVSLLFILIYFYFGSCYLQAFPSAGSEYLVNPLCSWVKVSNWWTLPYFLFLAVAAAAIFIIDFENKLIPDETTFLMFSVSFLFLLLSSTPNFYAVLFAGFFTAFFFLLLNFVTRGRGMGIGDVKLVLALSLAFINWQFLILWLFLSFAIGALVGIFLIIIGKAKFGKEIPFGPFLIVSFFITLFWGDLLIKFLFPYYF